MDSIVKLVQALNRNKVFKYFSSVKLAVPLMLVLAAVVAYGTVLESKYNADYSAMVMYKAEWFGFLLILLWVNIFCATVSRIPFKKHHTGFVITHIGLLTLLIGGYVTNSHGIDGQLSVAEGQTSSTVVLPGLMVGYQLEGQPSPMTVKFKKSIFSKDESNLSSVNDSLGSLFKVTSYIPFAKVEKVYRKAGDGNTDVALSFILKSNFFNVSEWLHTKNNPEMQLGPATLRIVKADNLENEVKPTKGVEKKTKKREVNSVREPTAAKEELVVMEFSGDKVVKSIDVAQLQKKPVSISGLKITLVKRYKAAVVAANKLEENLDPSASNPALELNVEKDGKSVREVLYGKFDQFSLNKDGVFGYKFAYKNAGVVADSSAGQPTAHQQGLPPGHVPVPDSGSQAAKKVESHAKNEDEPASGAPGMPPPMSEMGSRVIEFRVNPADAKQVRLNLYKKGELVVSELLQEGQSYQTPWMGMKVFLGSIQVGAEEGSDVTPINPEKRGQLPPSAVKIRTSVGDEFWLTEGEQKSVSANGKNFAVYFGREFVELPFDIFLQKFTKRDYPGTATAMSYESLVSIGQNGPTHLISMNEPLKQAGYTIYQSSYILSPGQTPVSVFSVNQDPGRFLKYLGSVILGIGVIVYTLMKSSWYRRRQSERENA